MHKFSFHFFIFALLIIFSGFLAFSANAQIPCSHFDDPENPTVKCGEAYYCGGSCRTEESIRADLGNCTEPDLDNCCPVGENKIFSCAACDCVCPSGTQWCGNLGRCAERQPANPDCEDQNRITNWCGECGNCKEGYEEREGICIQSVILGPVSAQNDLSTNSSIHIDKSAEGNFLEFFYTPTSTLFYVNKEGNFGADNVILGDNSNFLWADTASDAGNFILFQKDGSEAFKVTNEGVLHVPQICLDGVCKTAWPGEVPGVSGNWTGVENRPADKDYIFPDVSGDYGDATAGEEGGLRITDTGDLYMDGDLEVEGNANIAGDLTILNDNYTFTTDVGGDLIVVDESTGDTIMNISEGGGAGLWSSGPEEGEIYYNEGNVGIGLDNPSAKLEIDMADLTETEGLHLSRDAAAGHYSYLNIEDENANPVFKVHESGQVGIGIANPNRLLHLKTQPETNAEMDIQSGNKSHWAIYHDEDTEDLRFWNEEDRFVITKEGGVSIGGGCVGAQYQGVSGGSSKGLPGGVDGGYAEADSFCSEYGDGAHVCSTAEILQNIACGNQTLLNDREHIAWVVGGPPAYTAPANDCKGWTTQDHSVYGAIWDFTDGQPGGVGWLTYCDQTFPFACCK